MTSMPRRHFVSAAVGLGGSVAFGQEIRINQDELQVPPYTLPDPLVMQDGARVTSAKQWRERRRPELLRLFETHVFGRTPVESVKLRFEQVSLDRSALGGTATRKEVSIHFTETSNGPRMDLLIFLPNQAKSPVPLFVGLNFGGNHAAHPDPSIRLSTGWHRTNERSGYVNNRATPSSRGTEASRWSVAACLARGYGVATAYCGDLDPDFDDGFLNGVHVLFPRTNRPDDWGTIGAWAWGLSRAVDYFETDRAIDRRRVLVMGHSRLGKAALWAGAQDERFAAVISNNSGCGGAALSKRIFGETVRRINTSFPHWFCVNHRQYNDNESALPIDHHQLLALAAPRPAYVASAEEDAWADPKGEFLAAAGASPVYKLLGADGLAAAAMPPVNQPVLSRLGYHIRTGKHDVTEYDWQRWMDWAEKHLPRGR